MSTSPEVKKRNWFWTLIKTVFILAAICFVLLAVLANMGGSGDTFKKGLEGYISDMTGYEAEIETLHNVKFFPTVSFHFEGLTLQDPSLPGPAKASAANVILKMGFWDVISQSGTFLDIHAEDVQMRSGVVFNVASYIDHLSIIRTGDNAPYLMVSGHVGPHPLHSKLGLEMRGEGVALPAENFFKLSLGNASIDSKFKRTANNLIIEEMSWRYREEEVLSTSLSAYQNEQGQNELKGAFWLPDFGTDASFDLTLNYDDASVSGELNGTLLDFDDFRKGSLLVEFFDLFAPLVLKDTSKYLVAPSVSADVKMIWENFFNGEGFVGTYEKTVEVDDVKLVVTPGTEYIADFNVTAN